MELLHFSHKTEQSAGVNLAETVRVLIAAELLMHALLFILSSQFALWSVDIVCYRLLQCMLIGTVVWFGIVVPLCGRFRALACAGIEIAFAAAGAWYGWKHFDQLRQGLIGLCADYLTAWNAYYKTNYLVDCDGSQISGALGFLILVLTLLFLILRFVTNVRFLMLLPHLGALALGLLVNLTADWRGFACLFAGALVLYSGAEEQSKLVFAPVRQGRDKKRQVFAHYFAVFLITLAALLLVFVSDALFSLPAARIPEKAPKFMAFQTQLENRIQDFGSHVYISSNKERLDNSTPRYRNEVILTITADQVPLTNLYLPEFYSGTYQNGVWEKKNGEYRDETARSGIDGDRLGTLIRQMGYEYLASVPMVYTGEPLAQLRNYRIFYEGRKSSSALLPYFADLSSLQDEVWVEDEGLVKKRRKTDELSFTGWAGSMEVLEWAQNLSEQEGAQADGENWYSGYVSERYVSGSELNAVQRFVDNIDILHYDSDGVVNSELLTNINRLSAAMRVQEQLSKTAEYNLYLDDIPAGTDTIEYFLETGHEGYCMHFASAGVLILQELDIPARYAAGYIVKRDSFAEGSGGEFTAAVYDRNAHAWAEVYLEGIGWVPVEMTPGYTTPEIDLPTDADKQEELILRHEQKLQETAKPHKEPLKNVMQESETEEEASEQGVSGPQKGGAGEDEKRLDGNKLWRWAAAILALTLIFLSAVLIRFCLRRYREVLREEIRKKQNRRAVNRINRRIYRRLQGGGLIPAGHFVTGHGGVRWLGITDSEYEKKLIHAYPSVSAEDWSEYMRIVKKCVFSEEPIGARELQHCCEVYRKYRGERTAMRR